MEALQQSIIQRPNLVMGGIGAARNEADQRRLFEMQRQGQLVQGILQALGLWTDQQRFGANMDETQRQFNVKENIDQPQQVMTPGGMRVGQSVPFGVSQENRAAERHGWDAAVQGDPGYQMNQREAQLQQLLGMQNDNAFFTQTAPARSAVIGNQAEAGTIENRFNRDMNPMRLRGAEQDLAQGAEAHTWAQQDRPLNTKLKESELAYRDAQTRIAGIQEKLLQAPPPDAVGMEKWQKTTQEELTTVETGLQNRSLALSQFFANQSLVDDALRSPEGKAQIDAMRKELAGIGARIGKVAAIRAKMAAGLYTTENSAWSVMGLELSELYDEGGPPAGGQVTPQAPGAVPPSTIDEILRRALGG